MASTFWDDVWAIVLRCWCESPNDRPSADEIVSKLDEISVQKSEPTDRHQLLEMIKRNRMQK